LEFDLILMAKKFRNDRFITSLQLEFGGEAYDNAYVNVFSVIKPFPNLFYLVYSLYNEFDNKAFVRSSMTKHLISAPITKYFWLLNPTCN
jgi:hypothetical protein